MPLPTPNSGESHDDFVDRCMGDETMNEDFPETDQRRAVCEGQWEDGAQAMNYPLILDYAKSQPWAILPEKLIAIREFIQLKASGMDIGPIQAAKPRKASNSGAVAVIPVFGVLSQRMNLMTQMSGGTSTEMLGAQIRHAVENPDIKAVLLDVDSPGGTVQGIPELAAGIQELRSQKPIIASANSLMASAAYWLGASASEVVATPSADVGSIGVFTIHEDVSAALEMDGIKPSIISAGKFKVEGNPFEPLNDEAREAIQARVNEAYASFVADVAAGRNVREDSVRNGFGEGRVVSAKTALKEGMIDRIETFSQTLGRLISGDVKPAMRAAYEQPPMVTGDSLLIQRRKALLDNSKIS